jgi:hypothetical protein
MLFARFARSAAVLLLLTIGFAAPVHAQQNKQVISGTWYEDRAQFGFTTNGVIFLSFAQTPSDKFLNVTNVSCFVNAAPAQTIAGIFLNAGTTSGATDIIRPFSLRGGITLETTSDTKYYGILANQIFYKYGPGRFPVIEIDLQSTGSSLAQCVIVGNLTDN